MPGAGYVWFGRRGSDGKTFLSLARMLGDMICGAVTPLVYFGCISVAPEYLLVLLWSRSNVAMISDSMRYFEIILSLSPGHVEKDPSLIAWSMVCLVGQQKI